MKLTYEQKEAEDSLNDEELVVVWSGKDPLLPDRPTKPNETWTAPRRLYKMRICQVCGGFAYKCKKFGHIQVAVNTPLGGGEKEKV